MPANEPYTPGQMIEDHEYYTLVTLRGRHLPSMEVVGSYDAGEGSALLTILLMTTEEVFWGWPMVQFVHQAGEGWPEPEVRRSSSGAGPGGNPDETDPATAAAYRRTEALLETIREEVRGFLTGQPAGTQPERLMEGAYYAVLLAVKQHQIPYDGSCLIRQ